MSMTHCPRRCLPALAGVFLALCAAGSRAGDLDAPAPPSASGSAMYSLEDIWNRLDSNTQATPRSGAFTEPTAAPGPTGRTLTDIYQKAIPTQVPKTGQTTSYATGDDGDLEKGVAWPNPRFTDNANGTVTDNLTGLIWLKNADCFGTRDWTTALNDAKTLASPACGLSDGSTASQWRLPNIKELQSLVHYGVFTPALPNTAGTGEWIANDPFSGVQSSRYWSSTSRADVTSSAWGLGLGGGFVNGADKSGSSYVWPVRGGQ